MFLVRSRDRAAADAEAFAWFFTAEYPRVVRSLSHLVRREDAEDVAQEAFARLHQHWAKISRYEQPDAWVRRVALNRATRAVRRSATRTAFGHVGALSRVHSTRVCQGSTYSAAVR